MEYKIICYSNKIS